MKKLTALLLTAAFCLSLAACASSNPPASSAAPSSGASSAEPAGSTAPATNWPTDTVTFTVPASPGGGTDTQARIVADYLQRTTGVAFNVVNDTTGGNTVALENARHAKPDGTNLWCSSTPCVPAAMCWAHWCSGATCAGRNAPPCPSISAPATMISETAGWRGSSPSSPSQPICWPPSPASAF